jgi:hypothetical protein
VSFSAWWGIKKDKSVLTKTLLVAEALLIQTPAIKSAMGKEWIPFWDNIQALILILEGGPNPEFTPPLNRAIQTAFHSPSEPIIDGILQNHGFDYRFITGTPRRFSALKPGKKISPQIQQLWQRAQRAGEEIKNFEAKTE